MNVRTKEMYSEVYSILNMLGDEYKNKLPDNLIEMIKKEKLDSYNPKYDLNTEFQNLNIKKDTLAIIALFHLNYWCETEEEKDSLKKILKENQEKYDSEIREKYNTDNLFKKKEQNDDLKQENTNVDVSMVEYKESIFKKILKKIKNIFFH